MEKDLLLELIYGISFFIFNFIRLIIFTKALLFDKLIPKKIKKTHPCPLGYFVIAKKTFINE